VDEITNNIKGLVEIIAKQMIVKKVLRSLPLIFDAKVYVIEEIKDLDKLTMGEFHGILTTYEMRTKTKKPLKREATFKASKKMKNKEHKSSDCSSCGSDAEEATFVRKLKNGSRKYKGTFPFKCFNYGNVGHFAAKFPYEKTK
jgi:hypothetical protein